MQDRYVGDIGDFGKYGLLRELASGRQLRLGIVWYLHPDEDNADGRKTAYLYEDAKLRWRYRDCDAELYDKLRCLIDGNNRSVAGIRQIEIFPQGTRYHEQKVPKAKISRANWVQAALDAMSETEIVFLDPDNSISERSDPPSRKHIFIDEIRRFWERGHTLVIYHHLNRSVTALQQIERVCDLLKSCLKLPDSPWAFWYHRGTARAYFILIQEQHQQVLEKRLNEFCNSQWCDEKLSGFKSPHFELVQRP